MFQDQLIVVGIVLVGGDDDLLAGFQAVQHLVVPWVLPADADITLGSELSARVQYENPLTTCGLIESSFGQQNSLRCLIILTIWGANIYWQIFENPKYYRPFIR